MKRSIFTVAVVALAFSLVSLPAFAEWPSVTKAQMLTQLDGIHDAFLSQNRAFGHVIEDPNDAQLVFDYIYLASDGRSQHFQGVFWLFDGNGGDTGSWRNLLLTETREEIIQRGFSRLDRAVTRYDAALAKLYQMSDTQYRENAIGFIANARDVAFNIDRTLDYTEPRLDENMTTFPGVRGASANFGPHGWYRFAVDVVGSWQRNHKGHIRALAKQLLIDPGSAKDIKDSSYFVGITSKRMTYGLGLLAAVESPMEAIHLDRMEAGGTTTRSRHFFRGLLISESLLAFTHQGRPASIDINGRTMMRGTAYDMLTVCQRYALEIQSTPDLPPKIYPLAEAIQQVCKEWTRTDDFVQSAVVTLKWHQVFPPNAPKDPGEPPLPVCPELFPVPSITVDGVPVVCEE